MNIIADITAFVFAFIFMEAFAWFVHKYIMHGVGWFLHKSHHSPGKSRFEWNDLYVFIFALPAIWLMWLGTPAYNYLFWLGSGITAYGIAYFLLHDVIVHRRLRHHYRSKNAYLLRIIRAHKIHHKNQHKEAGQAFGFLYAHPKFDRKKTDE